jgi:iduronate 2-sulfatase
MSKLTIRIVLMALFCHSAVFSKEADVPGQQAVKNVLFIVVDDLTKSLGCYGNPVVKSPHIDSLAEMGVLFNGAYCNYSVCNPSRSSFLIGQRPETTGILHNGIGIQTVLADRVTLPALFKKNGFYTVSLGKIFHSSDEAWNDYKAWDERYDYHATELGKKGEIHNFTSDVMSWCFWQAAEGTDLDQPDGQVAQAAVEFLKTQREKPFFLAVGFHKPHDPYIAPKKYFDLYPLEELKPPVVPDDWKTPFAHSFPLEDDVFPKAREPYENFTNQDKKEFLRSYYACTTFVDAQVGKVLDALKETKQWDNTLIVFFSDHGYHLGEHDWWNKNTLFELSTVAPFIVVDPSSDAKGVASGSLLEFVDIYPTLADIFQLKGTPDYLEGKSFASLLKDPSRPFRSSVQAVMTRDNLLGKSVKNNKWRYIEWEGGKLGVELYDQENDPVEYNNLANNPAYKEVLKEMRSKLERSANKNN